MSIDQDKLDIGLEQKQNAMLDIKQGFYSPSEGEDGDTGVCINNGTHYWGVKAQNKWHFTELKKNSGLKDDAIISQSVNATVRNTFGFYLNKFSTTIKQIINQQTPRQFIIPFETFVFVNNAGTRQVPGVEFIKGQQTFNAEYNGIWTTLAQSSYTPLNAIASLSGINIPVPYKCKLKRYSAVGNFDVSAGNDTSSIEVGLTYGGLDEDLVSIAGGQNLNNTPDKTTTSGQVARWAINITNSPTFEVDSSAYCYYGITEASTSLTSDISGIIIFEEVL